jgi:hypothetical protein
MVMRLKEGTVRCYPPHTLKHQAQVAAVLESTLETYEMFFILRVRSLQLREDSRLLETRAVPRKGDSQ